MAIQSITLVVRDGEGSHSDVTLNFDGTITVSNMTTIALAAAGALEDIIDGAVVKAVLNRVIYVASIIAPDPTSDVEIKAKFIWDVVGTIKNTITTIPTFLRAKLTPGTRKVNLADADVATWVAFMTDGVAILGEPHDTEDRDVVAVLSAEEDYGRKRRR